MSFFSIYPFKKFQRVSLELIFRKKPMIASVWNLNLSIFRNADFSQRVSKVYVNTFRRNPYLSWDTMWIDSSLKET